MTWTLVSLLIQFVGFAAAFVAGYFLRASHEARRRSHFFRALAERARQREKAPWN